MSRASCFANAANPSRTFDVMKYTERSRDQCSKRCLPPYRSMDVALILRKSLIREFLINLVAKATNPPARSTLLSFHVAFLDRCMRCCESCDGDAEGGAAYVVQPDV